MKTEFGELRFKPELLQRLGLPDRLYPVPADLLTEVLLAGDNLPFELLLSGLQQHSACQPEAWEADEAAIDCLATLITPTDERAVVSVSSERWWLELGPVSLEREIVTVQRQDQLIAALVPREDGRLRAAVYRPLDAKSADYLTGLADRDGSMGRDNWGYALDSSAGMGNAYAAQAGSAYLSYWERGLGVFLDGTSSDTYRHQAHVLPRRPSLVATELGVFWEYGSRYA